MSRLALTTVARTVPESSRDARDVGLPDSPSRLSISAATRWVAVAARDEAHYLEARVANYIGTQIGPRYPTSL